MAGDPTVDEALRRLRTESDALCDELSRLPPEAWERPTNCDPWTVHVLAGHLLASVEPYLYYIQHGAQGTIPEYQSREERQQRIMRCAALEPSTLVSELREATDRFERELSALRPEQLDSLAAYSAGPRPLRWYVQQRLAEVFFHRWDVHQALGRPIDLDAATAAFLLPMLLEVNVPGIVARDKAGGEGRYRLAIRGGTSWLLEFSPGALAVRRDGAADVEATFEGDPDALALFIYGRRTLAELERAEQVSVSGDRAAAERFRGLFRGP